MKNYLLFPLVVGLLLLNACKEKDLPTDQIGLPVFQASGTVKGSPLAIIAGDDDYYMKSFFTFDSSQSVYEFGGELSQPGCQSCSEKLIISIRNESTDSQPSNIDLSSALQPTQYQYRDFKEESDGFISRFEAITDPSETYTYIWDLGNGASSTQPSFDYDFGNLALTDYTVKLKIESQSGCKSEISQTFSIPLPICQSTFLYWPSPTSTEVVFTPLPKGNGPYNYTWNFGDGTGFSSLEKPNYIFPSRGIYTVCLEIEDQDQCKSTICRNITAGNVSGCPANFKVTSIEKTIIDSVALSQVTVVWVDKSGTSFHSDALPQPTSSTFEIISREPFELNENGLPTEKLEVKFSCDVWDASGNKLRMSGVKAVIAVARPL